MQSSTIYLLRHGDCRADSVRRYIGQTDLPLNGTGRDQAAWWQERLAAIRWERIVCSDLSRSLETARIIAAGSGQLIEPLAQLREIALGDWDGLSMAELCQTSPVAFAERGADIAYHRPPGGESFADLARRVVPCLEELITGASGNLLLVGHAGVNRVYLCHLLGLPLGNLMLLPQDYGGLTILELVQGRLRLRSLNILPQPAGNITKSRSI